MEVILMTSCKQDINTSESGWNFILKRNYLFWNALAKRKEGAILVQSINICATFLTLLCVCK
jgi:hypothetical protein